MAPEWTPETGELATFIVRLTRGGHGALTAVVERVRTGEKARVERLEHLGRALLRMLDGGDSRPEPGTRAQPSSPGAKAPGPDQEAAQ